MDPERRSALELAKGREPSAAAVSQVAAATSAEAASWAFTQWKLRALGQTKFSRADEMLFVREALEQATHERLAAYHASRFPAGRPVTDLTVGIGADLIALAARGPASGYELDPERADCARHNLEAHGLTAEVIVGDGLTAELGDHAFADPSRRTDGHRLKAPDAFEPDPRALAMRFAELELGGIKLSPMLADDYLASLGGELEFVSFGRECREAVVWLGKRARDGVRAVHIETGSVLEGGGGEVETVPWPNGFLFEADPAAIRAHALPILCDEHDLVGLGDSNGYLTGAEPVESPWLRSYRVLDTCPSDDKTTRAKLRELGVGIAAVKVRGPKVDVDALVKRYKGIGARPAVLVVYAEGKSRRHAIVESVG